MIDNYIFKHTSELESEDQYFNIDLSECLLTDPDDVDTILHDPDSSERELMDQIRKDLGLTRFISWVNVPRITPVTDIRETDLYHLHSAYVTVVDVYDEVDRLVNGVYSCSTCGYKQELLQDDRLTAPYECPRDEGGCGKRASSTRFILKPMESLWITSQVIEVVDSNPKGSRQPKQVEAILEGDWTGVLVSGEQLRISYVPIVQSTGKDSVFHKRKLKINSFTVEDVHETEPLSDEEIQYVKEHDMWSEISNSIIPFIYGESNLKRILALYLFSGPEVIHVLMVGDPSTAKSEIMLEIIRYRPRSQFAVGGETSTPAMIGFAGRDSTTGKYHIQPGALSLAHNSNVGLDEVGEFSQDQLNALRESMAQGTIHLMKGDKKVKMMARNRVLGASNPKGGKFKMGSLMTQIPDKIDLPLRSRFDWMYMVRDVIDKEQDERKADLVMKRDSEDIPTPVSKDLIRKLVEFTLDDQVTISSDAQALIKSEYVDLRQKKAGQFMDENMREIDLRQLNTLKKSVRAIARMNNRKEAVVGDVEELFRLYKDNLYNITDGSMDVDEVNTGATISQRSLRTEISEFVKENEPVEKKLILESMVNMGFSSEDVEVMLKKLLNQGEVTTPSFDVYRAVG